MQLCDEEVNAAALYEGVQAAGLPQAGSDDPASEPQKFWADYPDIAQAVTGVQKRWSDWARTIIPAHNVTSRAGVVSLVGEVGSSIQVDCAVLAAQVVPSAEPAATAPSTPALPSAATVPLLTAQSRPEAVNPPLSAADESLAKLLLSGTSPTYSGNIVFSSCFRNLVGDVVAQMSGKGLPVDAVRRRVATDVTDAIGSSVSADARTHASPSQVRNWLQNEPGGVIYNDCARVAGLPTS